MPPPYAKSWPRLPYSTFEPRNCFKLLLQDASSSCLSKLLFQAGLPNAPTCCFKLLSQAVSPKLLFQAELFRVYERVDLKRGEFGRFLPEALAKFPNCPLSSQWRKCNQLKHSCTDPNFLYRAPSKLLATLPEPRLPDWRLLTLSGLTVISTLLQDRGNR